MTFSETIADLRKGKLDLIQYVNGLCDQIEKRETEIQALIPGTYDRLRVVSEAEALVARYPAPDSRPPMFGATVGVKDIIRVDGFPNRCGSALPGELFEGPEAGCISRLKRAGAIIMAKTVTTEFAYNEPGPTRNPYNPEHTPGGSSSGSAAGVAVEYFPLALGSQTVGSIIRPAAFCGVVGFKPSFERIAIDGVIPYSISTDHVGFFCKDPSAIGTVMGVLSDSWRTQDAKEGKKDLVLGIPEGPYLDQATPNGRAFFEKQIGRLMEAGWHIKRIEAFADFKTVEENHQRMIAGEMARYHSPWFENYRTLYRPRTREQIEKGLRISDEEIEAASARQQKLRTTLETQMKAEKIDGWICPPATDHAPKGLESTGNAVMNLPWTASGLPAVTIPAGLDGFGLPHGLQLVGYFMRDEELVPIARKLFSAVGSR